MRVGHSRVPHPCATKHCCFVRLACLIHAASVRSEPGSNSPNKILSTPRSARSIDFVLQDSILSQIFSIRSFYYDFKIPFGTSKSFSGSSHYSFFKDHLLYNHHRLHQAQWKCNLACFFILSNRFLNFFQKFFQHRLRQPRSFQRRGDEI